MFTTYEQYHAFSAPLEGRVPTMYCDVLGLITTGVGNLVNTLPQVEALHWLLADGSPAPLEVVRADWHKLHDNAQYYAKRAWHVYAGTMLCHLDDAGIDALVARQLAANEAILRKRFPAWDSFPADAQLAIMSMAWAVGAGFYQKFTILSAFIDRQDWESCVTSCRIREEGNPGVVPRNAKNRFCFHNAAIVRSENMPPDTLWWPSVAPTLAGAEAAHEAKANAEIQLAAWHALDVCPFTLLGAGAATIADEATL